MVIHYDGRGQSRVRIRNDHEHDDILYENNRNYVRKCPKSHINYSPFVTRNTKHSV